MTAETARAAVVSRLESALPETTEWMPSLSGIAIKVWSLDDLPAVADVNYPLVLVRSGTLLDETVLDRTTTARRYRLPIGCAAFDLDAEHTGPILSADIASLVRSVLTKHAKLTEDMRVLAIGKVDPGTVSSFGETLVDIQEFDIEIWSHEPTHITSGEQPVVVTDTEITVIPVDPSRE